MVNETPQCTGMMKLDQSNVDVAFLNVSMFVGLAKSTMCIAIILELTLIVGSAGLLDPLCHRRVGLKAIEWGPAASEIYS